MLGASNGATSSVKRESRSLSAMLRSKTARVTRSQRQEELVKSSAASKRQAVADLGRSKNRDDRARDNEVLFDLISGRPRRVRPPLGDVGARNHRSGSIFALTTRRQRSLRL